MTMTMPPDNAYDLLVAELKKLCGPREAIDPRAVKRAFHLERHEKGSQLVREGDIPEKIGFLARGLMKYYYIDGDGNEWIKHFSAEGDFVASYASFLLRLPSPYYIEAMEDAVVLSMPHAAYMDNIDRSRIWGTIARKYTERIYHEKEKREASFLKEDGKQRYASFLREYGRLAGRIALKDTASFLGLTPVSLSRIRAKIID